MCKICKHKYGSNYHMFYWLFFWIKTLDFSKALKTFWHIINRKAYRKWMNNHHGKQAIIIGVHLCRRYDHCEPPDEYIDHISELDATDILNEFYKL